MKPYFALLLTTSVLAIAIAAPLSEEITDVSSEVEDAETDVGFLKFEDLEILDLSEDEIENYFSIVSGIKKGLKGVKGIAHKGGKAVKGAVQKGSHSAKGAIKKGAEAAKGAIKKGARAVGKGIQAVRSKVVSLYKKVCMKNKKKDVCKRWAKKNITKENVEKVWNEVKPLVKAYCKVSVDALCTAVKIFL